MSLITDDDQVSSWWFTHEDYWFNSTPETDQIVLKNLGEYLLDQPKYDQLSLLGQILVDDQIARHYYRQDTPENQAMILKHHQKALQQARAILTETPEILETDLLLTPAQECFVLLPLRHSSDEDDRVEAIIWIKKLMLKRKSPYYERFLKASLIRVRNPTLVVTPESIPWDLICPTFSVVNLKSRLVRSCLAKDLFRELITAFEEVPKLPDQEHDLVVSISGGSDSMLVLWTAVQLGYRPIALMIDYGNRDEHLKEIQLVKWFTEKLKVPFYVRYIKAMQRIHKSSDESSEATNNMREFYEDVTRKIRFSAYQFFNIPVLLGHNWDDCFENCITNILTHRSPENLLGMSFHGVDSGVEIYRPFLKIKKAGIVIYCNFFGIPYLIDSTPKWSRRGKIRDDVRPALEQFDPHLTERIVETCQEQSQMTLDYQKLVGAVLIYDYRLDSNVFSFTDIGIRTPIFWRLMMQRITNMTGTGHVKIGSIRNLIEMLDQERDHSRKITLSKNLTALLPRTGSKEISILRN